MRMLKLWPLERQGKDLDDADINRVRVEHTVLDLTICFGRENMSEGTLKTMFTK